MQQHVKEIVEILMESEFYFDLSLDERRWLVNHLLQYYNLSPSADVQSSLPVIPGFRLPE